MGCVGRGRGGLARHAIAAALLLLTVNACTPVIGGIALLGVVSIGALTTRCYDYVDVTVLDSDGRKTCAATVTASKNGSEFELTSCYYAPLTDGRWTLRAALPGFPDAVTTVVVDHTHDCTRYVQSVELTLNRAGSVRPPPPGVRTPPPALPEPAPPSNASPPASQPAPADSNAPPSV